MWMSLGAEAFGSGCGLKVISHTGDSSLEFLEPCVDGTWETEGLQRFGGLFGVTMELTTRHTA